MSLNDYLVPVSKPNICFDCERACGGCSWSEEDPETKKIRFEPVPGWTARKIMKHTGYGRSKDHWTETYCITACPLFVKTPQRDAVRGELTQSQSELFLAAVKD